METLLELSLDELVQRTISAFPDTERRQNATYSVSVTDTKLLPADGTLIAKATVRGSGGQMYECVIQFENVKYNPTEEDAATFVSGDKEYKIVPIRRSETDVKVCCKCLDFRYRFAHYNQSADALYGQSPELYAKVPGSNRGPANPTHTPGVCKHLMDLADTLEQSGLFV